MPKGLKRAVSALLITFLVYCLLGFLLIPGIGLRVANQQLAQYATVPARLERIEFNPFSLELTLWGLRLGEEKPPARLPPAVRQPAAGQPVETPAAPGRRRAGRSAYRTAVRREGPAQPGQPVQDPAERIARA